MRFKPIPKRLLIHNIRLTISEDDSGWGGSDGSTEVISSVRFEPSAGKQKTSVNDEKLIQGTLFIDKVNSKPFLTPSPDDKIEILNDDRIKGSLTVKACDIIYTDEKNSVHHLEVLLV